MADPRNQLTIMVIPHADKPVWSFRLSLRFVQVAGSALIAMVLALFVFSHMYLTMAGRVAELEFLREENREQKLQLDYLLAEAESIRVSLSRLSELDRQIREILKKDAMFQGKIASFPAVATVSRSDAPVAMTVSIASQVSTATASGLVNSAPSLLASTGVSMDQIKSELTTLLGRLEQSQAGLQARQAYMNAKPSIWPTAGYITSGFGWRRSPFGWTSEFHTGLDIAAPFGTPVKATGAGKVIFAGYKGSYGRCIIIDHGYGIRTLYAHNARLNVGYGQWVSKGQVIAYVGDTGRSTGAHLHYEVHLNGRQVDPRDYLR
ncbi:MAG: M23 family metallopeptidase [Bacillota bacterium]